LYVQSAVPFASSAVCLHTFFKVVIDYFPKNSNQSAFVVDTDCVFCEVGYHFSLQRCRAMVRSLSGPCHIFGEQSGFFSERFVFKGLSRTFV